MSGLAPCACVQTKRVLGDEPVPDTCAIIVAGGLGERFGDPVGKQFVELVGLPVVAWSLLAFDNAPSVGHVVVVCPQDKVDVMRGDVLERIDLRKPITLAAAGLTRQDSVLSGLMSSPADLQLVAIHDGARPLIEVSAIERCIAAVRGNKQVEGALCASRETDTLKLVDEAGRVMSTPDRACYWCAQTPQVFVRKRILEVHERALLEGFAGTDDASLMEHAGGVVCVVETSRDNMKITVPEDLAIAEAILRSRMGIS